MRDSKTGWCVFIESASGGTGSLYVKAARAADLKPLILAADPSRYGFIATESVDYIQVDTANCGVVIACCQRLAKTSVVQAILSTSDYFLHTAARAAQQLGLPCNSYDALVNCQDKLLQREALKRNGIKVPSFRQATTVVEALDAARDLGFPVVIKPIKGTGSVGVRMCSSSEELTVESAKLLTRERNERGLQAEHRILVEQFVPGCEMSVEVFCDEVVGITGKHLGPLPRFIELGHDVPADCQSLSTSIAECALAGLNALGLGWGPYHVEIRNTRVGPVLIEVNARLAGDYIPVLYDLALGVDLMSATLRLVSGQRYLNCRTRHRASCVRFITPSRPGQVRKLTGVREACNSEGIYEIKTTTVGSTVSDHGDFRDRIGHVIAHGDDLSSASLCAETAMNAISIEIS